MARYSQKTSELYDSAILLSMSITNYGILKLLLKFFIVGSFQALYTPSCPKWQLKNTKEDSHIENPHVHLSILIANAMCLYFK